MATESSSSSSSFQPCCPCLTACQESNPQAFEVKEYAFPSLTLNNTTFVLPAVDMLTLHCCCRSTYLPQLVEQHHRPCLKQVICWTKELRDVYTRFDNFVKCKRLDQASHLLYNMFYIPTTRQSGTHRDFLKIGGNPAVWEKLAPHLYKTRLSVLPKVTEPTLHSSTFDSPILSPMRLTNGGHHSPKTEAKTEAKIEAKTKCLKRKREQGRESVEKDKKDDHCKHCTGFKQTHHLSFSLHIIRPLALPAGTYNVELVATFVCQRCDYLNSLSRLDERCAGNCGLTRELSERLQIIKNIENKKKITRAYF